MVERSEERKAQPVMEETQPINLGTADEPQEATEKEGSLMVKARVILHLF